MQFSVKFTVSPLLTHSPINLSLPFTPFSTFYYFSPSYPFSLCAFPSFPHHFWHLCVLGSSSSIDIEQAVSRPPCCAFPSRGEIWDGVSCLPPRPIIEQWKVFSFVLRYEILVVGVLLAPPPSEFGRGKGRREARRKCKSLRGRNPKATEVVN